MPRIHQRAIRSAVEGILVGLIRLHVPATVEHLRWIAVLAPRDLGGLEVPIGANQGLGDSRGEREEVGRIGVALKRRSHRRATVRVGGADQDLRRRDAGGLGGNCLRGLTDFARNQARIDHAEDLRDSTLADRDGAGVHRVGDFRRKVALHRPVDRRGKLRGRDILGVGAGREIADVGGRRVDGQGEKKEKEATGAGHGERGTDDDGWEMRTRTPIKPEAAREAETRRSQAEQFLRVFEEELPFDCLRR